MEISKMEISKKEYIDLIVRSERLEILTELIKSQKYISDEILQIVGVKEMFTDDPVRDMEDHYSIEREYIDCDICHRPIYKANDLYEGDYVYKIDGLCICEDCIKDYMEKYREELE